MKKGLQKLIGCTAIALTSMTAGAQTPVGTYVDDFTLTDINGNTHSLYQYLDQGKMVVIDISATWCGPCWSYHGTNALEDFYTAHGPAGANDAMVFFLEGDPSTTNADLNGTGTNTQGDWVTGSTHPIFDLTTTQANNLPLDIAYFPVMYVICPNRQVYASGVAGSIGTLSLLNSYVGQCAVATQPVDATIGSYTGDTEACGSAAVKVILQNMGTQPLTAATISATDGTNTYGPISWTGNLASYEYEEVTVGTATLSSSVTMTTTVTATSDANAGNNSLATPVAYNLSPSSQITVAIVTDRYGSETTWTIKNSSNVTVASGGPYGPDLSSNGTTTQTPVVVSLAPDCYTFKINDSYGDGICCSYGAGSYTVKYGSTTLVTGGEFTTTESRKFATQSGAFVIENTSINNIEVYPNPVNDNATVSVNLINEENVTIEVVNNLGQKVYSVNQGKLAAGEHNISLDFSNLGAGLYFVNVTAGASTMSKKITAIK